MSFIAPFLVLPTQLSGAAGSVFAAILKFTSLFVVLREREDSVCVPSAVALVTEADPEGVTVGGITPAYFLHLTDAQAARRSAAKLVPSGWPRHSRSLNAVPRRVKCWQPGSESRLRPSCGHRLFAMPAAVTQPR